MPYRIALAMACTVAFAMATAHAAPAGPVGLFQLQHTVVQAGGEPVGPVSNMAQDSDGFLWLLMLGGGGVLRYDGQQIIAPFNDLLAAYDRPVSLLLGPHGESRDIWIGHRRSGVTHIVDGVATHYEGGTLPSGTAFELKRDRAGVVWVVTTQGVARFIDGRWQPLPRSFGWTKPHPEDIAIDPATGDVYVQDADQGGLVSRGGEAPFVPVARSELDRAKAGLPPDVPWRLSPEEDGKAVLTSDGALWYSPAEGVDRFSWPDGRVSGTPPVHEHMKYSDGLSGQVTDILEDREGNVWLGTDKGLDRFRRPHATPLVLDQPIGNAIVTPMPDGSLWVSSYRRPPLRYAHGTLTSIDAIGDGISAVTPMVDGSLLFAGIGGLRRYKDGAVESLPVPGELAHVGTRFKQVIEDGQGGLWVIAATFGVYHVEHGQWTRMNGEAGLPAETPVLLRELPGKGMGFAYASGAFLSFADGHATRLPGMEGPGVGTPLAWFVEPHGMWVGGTRGLAHVEGGVVRHVARPGGAGFRDVSGIGRDTEGGLWVYHQDGVDRIEGGTPAHIAPGDGIGENATGVSTASSLVVDASGKAWVVGYGGVAWFDPAHVAVNSVQPKVLVETIVADRVPGPATAHKLVPALVHTLRIDYTAPMLRWPERSRFEYQLSGVDDTWQQAGTRRSAYYTNLSPGTYTFRVRAFNEDGVGSAADTVYHFRVAPMWYQTYTFLACMALLAMVVAWLAYRYRVQALTRRLRIRMDERERIARDLHDTLLQGFQGLVLRFQAIDRHVADPKAKEMIDAALDRADAVLLEGREKVAALRDSGEAEGARDLEASLGAIGAENADAGAVAFRVTMLGRPRELAADVFTNAVAIAREAALNAWQHAGASSVVVEADFGKRAFELRIIDNGRGFDATAERPGHWGLRGMRERARAVSGELTIERATGGGTCVVLRVKAARAYL